MSKVTIQIIQQDCHDEPDYGEILLFFQDSKSGDDVFSGILRSKHRKNSRNYKITTQTQPIKRTKDTLHLGY